MYFKEFGGPHRIATNLVDNISVRERWIGVSKN
jgi:hypothetical protein